LAIRAFARFAKFRLDATHVLPHAPILLTRTPYAASHRVARNNSPHMLASLPEGDADRQRQTEYSSKS